MASGGESEDQLQSQRRREERDLARSRQRLRAMRQSHGRKAPDSR
jgi:hypothetical protein